MGFPEQGFLSLMDGWDGLGVVVRRDPEADAWIFVALHDDTLGRPVGGCRMKRYSRPEEGLRDALRLARGMTWKWAAMGLAYGGGKAVLALGRDLSTEERGSLLLRFGELLESLAGAYGTGEDLGTTPEDMRLVATRTRWVVGLPPGEDGPSDPGPYTALGVLAGMRAALAHRHGDGTTLEERTVLVQGVGDVGAPLARLIAAAGGRVLVSDVNGVRAAAVAHEVGGTVVAPSDAYDARCDVYAPCALGATLNDETIERLRCGIVAGSANNQLEAPRHAALLAERGILYAPDYVINGGGAMAFGLLHLGEEEVEGLEARVRGIGDALAEIFAESAARGESPVEAARRRVERVLRAARDR